MKRAAGEWDWILLTLCKWFEREKACIMKLRG